MRKYVLAVLGLVFLLLLLALAGSALGAGGTYIVNTTSYTYDGSCDSLSGTTDCTLWEAIVLAGADAGTDTIAFDIPDGDANYGHNTAGVWTIVLTQTLASPDGDIVDGTTQATNYGSDTNLYGPEIEISGESLGSGITTWKIFYGNNTIKGLVISRGPSYEIWISGGDGNKIVGNYIGTDATGAVDQDPGGDGILIGTGAENNTIGGASEADRNVISGGNRGIRMFQLSTTTPTTGNVIEGNFIGTDRTGSSPLANSCGIRIESGAHDNTIGPNNVIAFNGWGVEVNGVTSTGNTITQNSIHSNDTLGIWLTNNGNHPIIAPVIFMNIGTSASGTAPPSSTVELFTGPDEEGKTYLTTVSADGSGNWSASGFLADDTYLTATATDAAGNTSQFSAPVVEWDWRTYLPVVTKNY
jgi:hypothetical protein